MDKQLVRLSKFLSLVLRHNPGKIGIQLDAQGWVEVETLLHAAKRHGTKIDRDLLRIIVEHNDKQRFSFSEDGLKIRANQGHSIDIDLGLSPLEPPNILYHGTAERFIESIRKQGLQKRQRHHVHLSPDEQTAYKVGVRHGKPVILQVYSGVMHQDGHVFYRSDNGVWLTESVPVEYLVFPLRARLS